MMLRDATMLEDLSLPLSQRLLESMMHLHA